MGQIEIPSEPKKMALDLFNSSRSDGHLSLGRSDYIRNQRKHEL